MSTNASNTVVKVPNGWLITMLEDGRYVPFFVKVREKDIIWDDTIPDEVIDTMGIYAEGTITHPTSYVETKINGWTCRFNGDLTCEFSKEVNIDGSFTLSDFDSTLTGNIDLPAKINPDRGFFPCVTSSCIQDELKTANIGVQKNTVVKSHDIETEMGPQIVVDEYYSDSFQLILTNPIYRFHKDFAKRGGYLGSSYFVTIRGILYTGVNNN